MTVCAGCGHDRPVVIGHADATLCTVCRPAMPSNGVDCQTCRAHAAVHINRAAMVWFCFSCGASGHVLLYEGLIDDRRLVCRN